MYDAVGYVGVAVAVALETIVAPIPSEVILPMAGWKVSQSASDPSVLEPLTNLPWNIPLAVLLATVGSVVGALVGYAIGAWGGRPILDRYGRYVGIGSEDLDRADRWFDRWGSWAVFFGRMVPLVRTFVSYPAGISRMPMGRFLLFSTLGSLPWNLALIYAGFVVGDNYEDISRTIKPFEYVIYAVVIAGVVLFVARWWRGKRQDRAAA
ncbi:MAG TPA: DedA family protein [Candidatus Limnocylindria bacterium]|jgi:membrane protein DedA with SNARE-associated domain|nr:DedA family protein [Candidatus Limnocylindria bacterium]